MGCGEGKKRFVAELDSLLAWHPRSPRTSSYHVGGSRTTNSVLRSPFPSRTVREPGWWHRPIRFSRSLLRIQWYASAVHQCPGLPTFSRVVFWSNRDGCCRAWKDPHYSREGGLSNPRIRPWKEWANGNPRIFVGAEHPRLDRRFLLSKMTHTRTKKGKRGFVVVFGIRTTTNVHGKRS